MANDKKATFLLEFKEKGIKIIEQTIAQLEELGIDSEEASKKIDDLGKAMKNAAKDAKKSASGIEDVKEEIEDVADVTVKSESRIKRFFRTLSDGTKSATKGFNSLSSSTQETGVRLSSLIKYAASYLAIREAVTYTQQLVSELDKVAVMADRAGVAFDKFNALNTVAKRFDINVEVLSDKFVDINELVSEAANFGSGSLVEVLGVLNLNAKELVKLKPDEQVMKLIKAMKGLDPNYQRQLIAAFNADDLIPLFNNFELVEQIQGRINRAGLNIDPKGIQEATTSFSVLKNDFDSFTKVVLTDLYGELDKMYGLKPNDDSLLDGETARKVAVSIANIVKVAELLGKSFMFVAQSVDLAVSALIMLPNIGKSFLETAGQMGNEFFNNRQQKTFDTYKELYADDPEALKEILAAEEKFLQSRQDQNDKFAQRQTNLVTNLGDILKKEYKDIGIEAEKVARSSDFSSFDKGPLVLEDIDNTVIQSEADKKAQELLDTINKLKADLISVNKEIEGINIDIQITPEKTPELNKKLQGLITTKNDILDKLNNKYKANTVSIIDVKNGQLELKQAKDSLEQYYKDVKAKNKEEFDKQIKVFTDQVDNVSLSVDLGVTTKPEAIAQLTSIYTNYEAYVKINGTVNELLTVQAAKQKTINDLKKQSLEIENLQIQLLRLQSKEINIVEIQRSRALSEIKQNIKNIEEQAIATDLTNKIFDIQKLQATLTEAETNIDKLQAKYENTDFFNTEQRLELEKQISVEKKIQEDTQKKLGIEAEKANTSAILTVKQVKQLDGILEESLLDNFSDFIAGTKSASEAFNDFATTFLKNISKMILQQLYLSALQKFNGGKEGTGGIASMIFGAIPSFHTGVGGGGSTSTFQPKVQIPGVTKSDEGLAILRKGEQVVTQNQQANQEIRNSSSTSNNTFYMDNEQVSKAALDNSFGEEYVLKIITKNRSTIKSL